MRDGWVWGLAAVPMGGGRTRAGRTQTTSPDRWEAAAWPAGPGRGAGGRWRGLAGLRDRPLRAARLACGDLAGGPPPTGTHSSQAQQTQRSRPAPLGPGGSRIRPLGGSQRLFQRIWVPSEPRRWQASTTRAAMPASADLPHVRGSYCFFTPTSPSILRTPS